VAHGDYVTLLGIPGSTVTHWGYVMGYTHRVPSVLVYRVVDIAEGAAVALPPVGASHCKTGNLLGTLSSLSPILFTVLLE
jgi:hypothetical protein